MDKLDEVLKACLSIFDRLVVSYAIMGGLAVRLLGIPRPPYDVDLTIAFDRERLPQ